MFFGGADEETSLKILTKAHQNLYYYPPYRMASESTGPRVELIWDCFDKDKPYYDRRRVEGLSDNDILETAKIFATEVKRVASDPNIDFQSAPDAAEPPPKRRFPFSLFGRLKRHGL